MKTTLLGNALLMAALMTVQLQAQNATPPAAPATPAAPAPATAEKPATAPSPQDEIRLRRQHISYLLGMKAGAELRQQGILSPDLDMFKTGVQDALLGKSQLSQEQLVAAQEDLRRELKVVQEKLQARAKENLDKSDAFMDANKSKEGVVTTASGLQYKVLTAGAGEPPKDTETVKLRYSGKKPDGKDFLAATNATHKISDVKIKGLHEALLLMKPGAKWEVYVPPQLGFGALTQPGIGPNEVMILNVELLSVEGR